MHDSSCSSFKLRIEINRTGHACVSKLQNLNQAFQNIIVCISRIFLWFTKHLQTHSMRSIKSVQALAQLRKIFSLTLSKIQILARWFLAGLGQTTEGKQSLQFQQELLPAFQAREQRSFRDSRLTYTRAWGEGRWPEASCRREDEHGSEAGRRLGSTALQQEKRCSGHLYRNQSVS